MSCGLRHFAFRASSYQLCSGPRASAQPGRSQNFVRELLAITLITRQYLPFWEIRQRKGLAALFEAGSARKVQPKHAKRLNLILTALNAATQAAQMAMPGMRFHPLH